jgi:hypothetical protein
VELEPLPKWDKCSARMSALPNSLPEPIRDPARSETAGS